MRTCLKNLAFDFSQQLKPYRADRFLVAVSGGRDSVCLFYLFLHLKKHLGMNFVVGHVHHGDAEGELGTYRNQAREFVNELATKNQVSIVTNPSGGAASLSEADMRQFRHDQLQKLAIGAECQWVVLAHHYQDQLETQMIRLIRGTGGKGFQGMTFRRENLLRPLLSYSPEDLESYLDSVGGQWLEDPSNQITNHLRNWLRQSWLPELEAYRPGSLASLGRSLNLIAQDLAEGSERLPEELFTQDQAIDRSLFLTLDSQQKQRALAQYMRQIGLRNYGLSHINEILKRIDSEQKNLTFRLLRREWILDAEQLKAQGPGEIEDEPGK